VTDAVIVRADDGSLSVEWEEGQREALMSRELLEQFVEDRNVLRGAVERLADPSRMFHNPKAEWTWDEEHRSRLEFARQVMKYLEHSA
jgi:hypothetical protein